ncbi:hypothetical protein [Streptomyces pseudovenezuelae]|uniref:hypothetical protein n=1 Tax=Streptomyces pseudovenezuelae TaxID=67350 RepID=UPI0036E19711
MTGPSASTLLRGGRPIPLRERMFGLWVDLGDFRKGRGWQRPPEARFTCRYGCVDQAVGAVDVAEFTARIDEAHARTCPGAGPPH